MSLVIEPVFATGEFLPDVGLAPHVHQSGCAACGFTLWNPIESLKVADVGMYDDRRFPGRLLVSLRQHYEHLDELPPELLSAFMADVQSVSHALRRTLDVERVNVAILGNQEAHVHAHVIPRRPSKEPAPRSAPWEDPRLRGPPPEWERKSVFTSLRQALCERLLTA